MWILFQNKNEGQSGSTGWRPQIRTATEMHLSSLFPFCQLRQCLLIVYKVYMAGSVLSAIFIVSRGIVNKLEQQLGNQLEILTNDT